MMSLESTQIQSKVDSVHALPTPTTITELQKFLGMVTYLKPFIPGPSTLTAPLHELLKKDAEFSWDASYQTTFQSVRDAVVSDTTLRYFDVSCPITVQVDTSQVGLGAALLQDSKPVAFASKALTGFERRYANIEREMLAIVFRAERLKSCYASAKSLIPLSVYEPMVICLVQRSSIS